MTVNLDVSILIVNWNSKDFLRKCLTSIYRETHGLTFETIVVDNGSFDGSAELVRSEFPQVRFIQSETNLGFARANNLAFAQSSGRAVLLLNPDTEIIGNAISAMSCALQGISDAGIVGCQLLNTDSSIQTQCIKRFPNIVSDTLSIEWLRLKFPSWKLWAIDPLFSATSEPVRVDAVCGACQMIRRGVYEAIGGLNANYFMYSEDVEISAVALARGWKTYYLGAAKVVHHAGKSSGGRGRGERWVAIMQAEAQWQFYRRWRGEMYAGLYRLTMGLISLLRIFAIVVSCLPLLYGRRNEVFRIWQKWTAVLQWSLGLERITRQFAVSDSVSDMATSGAGSAVEPNPLLPSSSSCDQASVSGVRSSRPSYVLMTAAHNEESQIETTIQSVVNQSCVPVRWIVVSDGSTDRTDEIVRAYAKQYSFIQLLRIERPAVRSFRSKVLALQSASKLMNATPYDFIGNIDADISVGSSYFEDLIERFHANPKLGIAGGFLRDRKDSVYQANHDNRTYAVPHGAQLVRRECYQVIGGYAPLEYGGEDWHAHVSAVMNDWAVRAFPELPIFHERPTGEADRLLKYKFRQGRMDYSLGSDPVFEVFKCLDRVRENPPLLAAAARAAGFCWSWIRRDQRPVSQQFISFLRSDQRQRLGQVVRQELPRAIRAKLAGTSHFLSRIVRLLISLVFFAFSKVNAMGRGWIRKGDRGSWVILCYHDVPFEEQTHFARQMDILLKRARPIPLDSGMPLPPGHYVSVTFDDGMASFIEHALPELEKRQIPSTLFVVSGKLGQHADWARYAGGPSSIITTEQLRAIADRVLIGAHTISHPLLTQLDESDAKAEIKGSRTALERTLSKAIEIFSFPYGEFDEGLCRLCVDAGYKQVFTIIPTTGSITERQFVMGRITVEPTDWPLEFQLKLLGGYSWLPFAFGLKRRVRLLFRKDKPKRSFEAKPATANNID